jgi:hypothetical protein
MIRNKIILGLVIVSALFLLGCMSLLEPPEKKQYLCEDGKTIVSDLTECPRIDKDLQDCEEASSIESYGPSESDMCYFELALDRENISLCRKVRNTDSWYDYTAAKCGAQIAMYQGEPSLCDELSFVSKYDCYLELASELEDPSVCAEISSVRKRDDCYSSLASALEDPSVCSYISTETDKDECIYDYVYYYSYYVDDWSICEEFSASADTEQSYCYYEAADSTGELSYCDKMTTDTGYYSYYTKGDCYGGVAKYKRDVSICEQLTDADFKDDCYYEYATSYPYDVDACDNIADEYTRDDCIYWANDSYYY